MLERPRLVAADGSAAATAEGGAGPNHRGAMAADWDAAGQLQLDHLVAAGLRPEHRVLDVGCGMLRAGVKLAAYLEPKHYFGIDSDKPSLDIGYERELGPAGLQERCPRPQLFCSGRFKHERLDDGVIDFGLCVSVLRELPLNYLRLCLENAAPYFRRGGTLHLSYLEIAMAKPFGQPYTNMARFKSFGAKSPYHYYRRDLENACIGSAWSCRYFGAWGHADGESMMIFSKSG